MGVFFLGFCGFGVGFFRVVWVDAGFITTLTRELRVKHRRVRHDHSGSMTQRMQNNSEL